MIAQILLRMKRPLPPDLAEWFTDVMADRRVKGKKKKRRPRPATGLSRFEGRDKLICLVISLLKCQFNLSATRNAVSPPASACDVVAAVIGKPYKTIEGIWNRRAPLMTRLSEEVLIPEFLNLDPLKQDK